MSEGKDSFAGTAEHQFGTSKDWYSRGYLPHRDHPGLLQAITCRLADSLPAAVLEGLKEETARCGAIREETSNRKRLEYLLDAKPAGSK